MDTQPTMKSIILSLTCLTYLSQVSASVESGQAGNKPPSNDVFIGQQWSLFNNGQKVSIDLDDIHPMSVGSDGESAMGWKNYDYLMKKDVIVAIIDSGVDTAHPELKDRLLPGKNFTDLAAGHDTLVDDSFGHGTHLAGILGSKINNGEGISGLTNRVKIVPIKYFDQKEFEGTRRIKRPMLDRIKGAIEFAMESGADIINLSVGWPREANSPDLEAVFKKALKAGALIVAAAGNDHHNVQIYPCAYQGVICVGASGIDGKMTRFTNFGNHVDIMAPGQEILGLSPLMKKTPVFGVLGYEVKSGSSQAAIMVSGALAILKGVFTQESTNQIRQRLLGSAKAKVSVTGSLYGQLNIQGAIDYKLGNSSALPIFKGIEQVIVAPKTLSFQLPVLIEGGTPGSLGIRSLSKGVSLKLLKKTNQGYLAEGRISGMGLGNHLDYELTLGKKKYFHSVILSRSLESEKFEESLLAGEDLKDFNQVNSTIFPSRPGNQSYWMTSPREGGLELTKWEGGAPVSRLLEGLSAPLLDFGLTGINTSEAKFLFGGLAKNEQENSSSIYFYYLNSAFEVVKKFLVDYKGAVPSANGLALGKFGTTMVPVFWDIGLIPIDDAHKDSFEFEEKKPARRIFYFEPKEDRFVTRTLMASALTEWLNEKFNYQNHEVISLLPQSNADLKSGKIKLLIFVGKEILGTHYVVEISDLRDWQENIKLTELKTSLVNLVRNSEGSAWDLTHGLDVIPEMRAIYSETAARSVILTGSEIMQNNLNTPKLPESIGGIVKTFFRDGKALTIIQTSEAFRVQGTWPGVLGSVDSHVPLATSSFLPGQLFGETVLPVIVGEARAPGLLINRSSVFLPVLILYSLEQNEMKATVGSTFAVPPNCGVKNPSLGSNGRSIMSLLCKVPGGFKLKNILL